MITKCHCPHCDGGMEFEAEAAGEQVNCPHCGKETVLQIPKARTNQREAFTDGLHGREAPPVIKKPSTFSLSVLSIFLFLGGAFELFDGFLESALTKTVMQQQVSVMKCGFGAICIGLALIIAALCQIIKK